MCLKDVLEIVLLALYLWYCFSNEESWSSNLTGFMYL